MVKENIIVTSQLGIHLRPAGAMCDAAIKFDSNISFEYAEGKTANAKSVISILASGVKCGDEITLTLLLHRFHQLLKLSHLHI